MNTLNSVLISTLYTLKNSTELSNISQRGSMNEDRLIIDGINTSGKNFSLLVVLENLQGIASFKIEGHWWAESKYFDALYACKQEELTAKKLSQAIINLLN